MPASRQRGFTLIETLIATALVVTVCLGSAQIFVQVLAHTAIARDQMLMGIAARAKLEELSTAVASGATTVAPADAINHDVDGWHDVVFDSGRRYLRRWEIAAIPGYFGRVFAITVRIVPAAGGPDVRLVSMRRVAPP